MRHEERWVETKYVRSKGRLRANRSAVGRGSILVTDIVAAWYDRTIPRYAAGQLLDLGCGTAPLHGTYRPFISGSTCVDWPGSLHGSSHVDVAADLAEVLPLETGSFDTVIFSDVLEHLREPWLAVAEIHRVLRPGGHLIMNLPFMYWLHEAPHDHQRLTQFALRRLLEESGLNILELEAQAGALAVVADIVSKVAASRSPTRFLAAPVQTAAGWCLRWPRLRDLSVKDGLERFPIGYFAVARKD